MLRSPAARVAFAATAGLLLATSARADDGGLWLSAEGRIPLAKGHGFAAPKLRIENEARFRFTDSDAEIDTMRVRAGVFWDWENLRLPAQLVLLSNRGTDGAYDNELRGEIEPTPRFVIGDVQISDRNRGQVRISTGEVKWMYQNRLRFRLQPQDWPIWPFVQDEFRLSVDTGEFEENRAAAGLGFRFSRGDRVDVAYLYQSRNEQQSWLGAHVIQVSFLFTISSDRD